MEKPNCYFSPDGNGCAAFIIPTNNSPCTLSECLSLTGPIDPACLTCKFRIEKGVLSND